MKVTIHPKKLQGSLIVPPSKSLSHRAIIAASLAEGKSIISNVILSKDILATIEGMRALGASIEVQENTLYITGSKVQRKKKEIYANESGSSLRFLIPIALVCGEPVCFTGQNHLVKRPLDSYFEIFDQQGISYSHPEGQYLPLQIEGRLRPGSYEIRGDISSQFITGLLYALPLLEGDSRIKVTTALESKGYVDLTLDILKRFGITIINHNYEEFYISGNQTYKPYDYQVEGDYSQVAFFLVAGALGADIKLYGMNEHSYQGDKKILLDMESFGAKLEITSSYIQCTPGMTKGAIIDFSQSPDLGPALTVLASLSVGTSKFIHAERLRIKECDRITCMRQELAKMGAHIVEQSDGMTIEGVSELTGAVLDSHNDHRVAMALAMASLKTKGDIILENAECVTKSFPDFWKVFEALGGDVSYE